jgi:hypothetical protein
MRDLRLFSAVLLKCKAVWDVTLCRSVTSYGRFEGSIAFIIGIKQPPPKKGALFGLLEPQVINCH